MSYSKADPQFSIASLALLTIPVDVNPEGGQILAQINQDITQLNILITAYNQASDQDSRIACLQALDNTQQRLGTQYADKVVTLLPEYRGLMHKRLFDAMWQQRELLGVRADYQPQGTPFTDVGAEAGEIINNMAPAEYAKFEAIVATGTQPIRDALLKEVYANDLKGDAYRAFINAHDIEFIGGQNSTNFKFTHCTTKEAAVVRYSNNLNHPKQQEYDLRARLKPHDNFLIPQWADRRGSYVDPEGKIQSGRISVIGFSPGKTIDNIPWHTFTLKAQQQGCIEACLSQLLLHKKMYSYGKAWPDGKNDNIFFHRDPASGRILATVADCKAFCELKPNHRLAGTQKDWLKTRFLSAPECFKAHAPNTIGDIDADKMTVYTIGKNLYESVLLSEPAKYQLYLESPSILDPSLSEVDEFSEDYFREVPIFKSNATGQALEALIQDVVKLDATQRLSSDEMLQRLIVLKYASQPPYVDLVEKIKKILALAFDDPTEVLKRDQFMLRFYEELLDKRHDIYKLHADLDRIVTAYQKSVAATIEEEPVLSVQSALDKLEKIAAFPLDDPQLKLKQTVFVQKWRRTLILSDAEDLSDIHKELDRVIANFQQHLKSDNPSVSYRDEMQQRRGGDDLLSSKVIPSRSKH